MEALPPLPLGGQLVHNLLLFGRLLRGLGLEVNPGRVMDLTVALGQIDIGRRSDFYYAARSLLVHKREDLPLFDQAFHLFWRPPTEGRLVGVPALSQRPKPKPRVVPPPLRAPDPNDADAANAHQPPPETVLEITRTYSPLEALRRKDFAALTTEEYEAIRRLMAQLTWRLGLRRTRRYMPGGGLRLDLRRTLRRNLKYGGQVLAWSLREPQYKPRPVVVLADISGSMERYTRLLLHFLYSLARGLGQPVETFVFSTRLTPISRPLRHKDVDRALSEVARAVTDWSGGTRIGEALKEFNFHWGRRVLGRGAVVLIISDGWDRGDPALAAREMARLQRTCHRLIWLNPLLGSPEYEPLTRGMQAALPYVDDFLPVHNLASLEELADHLATLDDKRRR
ncbi:MAG: VWA domain-containing protein [Anaerolineales bacterium]|nr:VWA domain-containing protein [Anaerolineales bacterium]